MNKVKPSIAKKFIEKCLVNKLPVFIKSSPGCGKSSLIRDLAEEFNLKLIDHRLSTSDITDLNGLPKFEDNKATFVPFDIFPLSNWRLPEGKEGWLLFLDEFNSASKAVQAASYKLILDRCIGQHKLHDRCLIVCAGNLDTDKAITNTLSTAMMSRLVHIEMEPDLEDFINVANAKGYDSRIVAYLSMFNDELCNFNPEKHTETFNCPRTWEFTSKLIKDSPVDESMVNLLQGVISGESAVKFCTFCSTLDDLTTPEEIVNNPMLAKISDSKNCQYATISALIQYKDLNKHLKDICTYVNRFNDRSLRVMFFRAIVHNDVTVMLDSDFMASVRDIIKFIKD